MFTAIQQARTAWMRERLDVISDVHVLVSSFDERAGAVAKDCLDCVMCLDDAVRSSLCRDHVFSHWIDDLRRLALKLAYAGSGRTELGEVTSVLNLMRLSVSALGGCDFEFALAAPLPQTLLLPVSGLHAAIPLFASDEEVRCRYRHDSGDIVVGDRRFALSRFSSARSIKIVDRYFECFSESGGDGYSIAWDVNIDPERWTPALAAAVDLIQSDDTASDLVSSFVSYIVPLRQTEVTVNLSFSARSLPNVVFKNNELTPFLVGETLVHEADHQFFYAIEGGVDFWNSKPTHQQATYLSPWRDDPRPLDGILRGLSSFARVSAYYSNALRTAVSSDNEREAVGAMLLRRLRESEVALATLRASGQLSECGNAYVDEMSEALDSANRMVTRFPQYDVWRSVADSCIADHRDRWKRNNESR